MPLPAIILAALPSVAKMLGVNVFGLVEKYMNKEITKAELEAGIERASIESATAIATQQANVIIAEAKGESWLQRNWRPVVALVAFFSCWFVIFPYAFFVQWGWLPQVRFGEAGLQYFFTLTTVCVGGYIGGRTLEKMTGRGK
jgi:hypothetical protein